MFKLTVEPNNPKKIIESEYKGYLIALKALRDFKLNEEAMNKFADVVHLNQQLKAKVKAYRAELRSSSLKYQISYIPKRKSWATLLPEIQYSFVRDNFISSSILKNTRHQIHHRNLMQTYATTKNQEFLKSKAEIRTKIYEKKKQVKDYDPTKIHNRSVIIKAFGDRINYKTCCGIVYKPKRTLFNRGESPRGKVDEGMGVYMRFMKSKDKEMVFREKKPTNADSHVGVEIEFGCDLNAQDLAFALLEEDLHEKTFLKTDGSVKVGPYNHELCVLDSEKGIYETIKKVGKVLASCNSRVNKTCGLHVHLDMRHRNAKMAFNNLVCAQNILYAMNPYARQAGSYCRRVDTKDFELGKKGGHYDGINASAHTKHKTIEIRIHSGTVNEKKINNWIKLLLLIVNKTEETKKASSSFKEFVSKFGIDKQLADYMHERMNKFLGEENKNASEDGAA